MRLSHVRRNPGSQGLCFSQAGLGFGLAKAADTCLLSTKPETISQGGQKLKATQAWPRAGSSSQLGIREVTVSEVTRSSSQTASCWSCHLLSL
jgi:hypothetical protein